MRRSLLLAGVAAGLAGAMLIRRARRLDPAGRVVLITGGSRGLGLELARRLAAEGALLALIARNPEELERAARDLGDAPVETITCDIRDAGQVDRAVERVVRRFGRLDILVNNASIIRVGPFTDLTAVDFRNEMDINFFGAVHATRAALPHLRRSRGRIVNITSIGGRIPVPHLAPYVASKFAMVGFSETLHAELAASGVRVTTVTPGLMRTGSPYRAQFKGRSEREFRWFLLAGSLPVLSIDSRRAARAIVEGALHGDTSVVVPAYIRLPLAAHGLAPAIVTRIATLVARFLPEPTHAPETPALEGRALISPEQGPAYAALTTRAARRNNELG